jgi:hypothetical protein
MKINPIKPIERPEVFGIENRKGKKVIKNDSQKDEVQLDKIEHRKGSGIYQESRKEVDAKTIQRLKAESEKAYSRLRDLVIRLLKKQESQHPMTKDVEVHVDNTVQEEAKKSVSDGGPFSPERLSDRIVDFARALSGGDKEKISTLRKAIEEGFNEAAKVLGGLPDISLQTYDLVMEKLDRWENE